MAVVDEELCECQQKMQDKFIISTLWTYEGVVYWINIDKESFIIQMSPHLKKVYKTSAKSQKP